jgi:hypothetical protein
VKRTCGSCYRWHNKKAGWSCWGNGKAILDCWYPKHRRFWFLLSLILIAVILVLAATLVWAIIDPAHNPPKRGEVPVHYTDFFIKEDEGYSFPRVMDGIIYLDAAGLRIKNVTVWGIGSDGSWYIAKGETK